MVIAHSRGDVCHINIFIHEISSSDINTCGYPSQSFNELIITHKKLSLSLVVNGAQGNFSIKANSNNNLGTCVCLRQLQIFSISINSCQMSMIGWKLNFIFGIKKVWEWKSFRLGKKS